MDDKIEKEWISPTEEQCKVAAKRLLDIAVKEMKNGLNDTNNTKLLIGVFSKVRQENLVLEKAFNDANKGCETHGYDLDIYWVISTAVWVCTLSMQDRYDDVHPFSESGYMIKSLIKACLILKSADDLNTTVECISEDYISGDGDVYDLLNSDLRIKID